jgi:hypothetical protein
MDEEGKVDDEYGLETNKDIFERWKTNSLGMIGRTFGVSKMKL